MTLEDGAFAATRNGELVVELGRTDQPALIFSGTKGLVAMCLLLLIERGLLELEAPVSRYWPEFRHGDVLVRHVVSHTAGLPGLRPPPTAGRVRRFGLPALGRRRTNARRREGHRRVYFAGRRWVNCPIVDRETLETVPAFSRVVPDPDERVKPELFECLVELATPVVPDARAALAALRSLRSELARLY